MPIDNLKAFNRSVKKAARDLPAEQSVLLQKKIAFEGMRRVVQKTPVDTGRARGNWQTTIGRLPLGELEVEDKTGTVAITSGVAALAKLPPYQIVYIGNNVSYILVLEQGIHDATIPEHQRGPFERKAKSGTVSTVRRHTVKEHVAKRGSKRAPQGMVALTLDELGVMFR
jgi:hypothetical protein